jgi:hypothetical protein
MKKTLKILTTTTASTILLSIATSCGAEEQASESKSTKANPKQNLPAGTEEQKFQFKIGEIKDSVNAERCRARCVITDQ